MRVPVERGALAVVHAFALNGTAQCAEDRLLVSGLAGLGARLIEVDEMVVATGLRPDLGLLREVRVCLDPRSTARVRWRR